MENKTQLQYPIGKYSMLQDITEEKLKEWITILEMMPAQLRDMVSEMNDEQLDTPYREEGWTVRQVVHHLADSHHHSYIRFKWALTEDTPLIKPYFEKKWTDLPDLAGMPVEWSLRHLEVVHYKLVRLLKLLTPAQFDRSFIHPEGDTQISLRQNVGQYAWHSMHHYMHIKNLVTLKNW